MMKLPPIEQAMTSRATPVDFYGSAQGGGSVGGNRYGTQGGGGVGGTLGYKQGDVSLEASGGMGGGFFLPSDQLKAMGVENVYSMSDPQLNGLKLTIEDVFNRNADERVTVDVTPNQDMNGVDGVFVRFKKVF